MSVLRNVGDPEDLENEFSKFFQITPRFLRMSSQSNFFFCFSSKSYGLCPNVDV